MAHKLYRPCLGSVTPAGPVCSQITISSAVSLSACALVADSHLCGVTVMLTEGETMFVFVAIDSAKQT